VPDKPSTAAGYKSEQVELVRATCLYVATKLGDIMDELVVIGGLVPSLLIKQDELPGGADAHVGTVDLDVGLTLALLAEGRYKTLTERLRRAGFEHDVNDEGKSHPATLEDREAGKGHCRLLDSAEPSRRPGRQATRYRARLRGGHRTRSAPCLPGP
jgi:hypothetical protein